MYVGMQVKINSSSHGLVERSAFGLLVISAIDVCKRYTNGLASDQQWKGKASSTWLQKWKLH